MSWRDAALFNRFLSQYGYDDPETAPDSVMEAAADDMVAWAAKAEKTLAPAEPTDMDIIDKVMEDGHLTSADADELAPYIDRAHGD